MRLSVGGRPSLLRGLRGGPSSTAGMTGTASHSRAKTSRGVARPVTDVEAADDLMREVGPVTDRHCARYSAACGMGYGSLLLRPELHRALIVTGLHTCTHSVAAV